MEITNYKSQITNKSQFPNYKLQTVGAKNFSPLLTLTPTLTLKLTLTVPLTLFPNTNH